MNFNIGDTVLYCSHGVCKIAEISKKKFNGMIVEYYVLKPVYNDSSTIFVPSDNEALTAKMHRILSAEEIYSLIKAMPEEEQIWIEDEPQRRERYKEILSGSDRTELIRLIKTLYLRRQAQNGRKKKLHMADEKFLKDAENLLHEEFAHVLNIKREQVLPFILRQIEVDEKLGPKAIEDEPERKEC